MRSDPSSSRSVPRRSGLFPRKKRNKSAPVLQTEKIPTYVRLVGTLRGSDPKYATIFAAAQELAAVGVTIRSIRTSGETSGHMGTFGFDREYPSAESFAQNVLADMRADMRAESSWALSWNTTFFNFETAPQTGIEIVISIPEDDGLQKPCEALWWVSYDAASDPAAAQTAQRTEAILQEYAPEAAIDDNGTQRSGDPTIRD